MSGTTSYPYETRLNVHCQQGEVIDERALADACAKWYNQTLCQVNESVVRLGVVQGYTFQSMTACKYGTSANYSVYS
jgi:hypothetical protein